VCRPSDTKILTSKDPLFLRASVSYMYSVAGSM
jgi:hypothetical protein